jgi:phosphoribosylaminoimidazole (AIR) synthetase
MGIGMVWFVPAEQAEKTIKICENSGFKAAVCGKVVAGNQKVTVN